MLKQIAPNEWEIVPTPFPEELKEESKTVLKLAEIGFVSQGFDGNFHSFLHRYVSYDDDESVPVPVERYNYEELLVHSTGESILIGYVSEINVDSNNLTRSGYITPAVDFKNLQEVLVITTTKAELTGQNET